MKKIVKKVTAKIKAKTLKKPVKESEEVSAKYLAYKVFLDAYALERPEKFATRKDALLAKLESLK